MDLSATSRQIDAMGIPMAAAQESNSQRLRAALAVLHECRRSEQELQERVAAHQSASRGTPLASPLEPLATVVAAGRCPDELDIVAVDGSQIDVDRHSFLPCYLLNIGRVRISYGGSPDASLSSVPYLRYEESDLYIADPLDPHRREPVAGALLHARRNVTEMRELAALALQTPSNRAAVALLDNSLVLWGLAGRRFDPYVKTILLEEYAGYLQQLAAANRDRPAPIAGYISRPDGSQIINLLRAVACEPANCRHCLARLSPVAGACDYLAGLRDRDLFARLLRLPGQRSALFRSLSSVVREHPYGTELYFFYLQTGEEIARVEIPEWVALQPDRLALVHAALAQQIRQGQGYPQALMEAHEQAVVGGADRDHFWFLVEQMLAERRLPADASAKAFSKRTRGT